MSTDRIETKLSILAVLPFIPRYLPTLQFCSALCKEGRKQMSKHANIVLGSLLEASVPKASTRALIAACRAANFEAVVTLLSTHDLDLDGNIETVSNYFEWCGVENTSHGLVHGRRAFLTPLEAGTLAESESIVALLIDKSANINNLYLQAILTSTHSRSLSGDQLDLYTTPLASALRVRFDHLVKLLLEKKAELIDEPVRVRVESDDSSEIQEFATPLTIAMETASIRMLALLTEAGCHTQGEQCRTIFWADDDACSFADCPPFAYRCNGWQDHHTPLMKAVLSLAGDFVDHLLEHGASPSGFQRRRLSLAVDFMSESEGDSYSIGDFREKQTPLAAAVELKAERIISSLLKARACVNGPQYKCNSNESSYSPLLLAIIGNQIMAKSAVDAPKSLVSGEALVVRMVQSLLRNRAEVNGVQGRHGRRKITALTASLNVLRRFTELRTPPRTGSPRYSGDHDFTIRLGNTIMSRNKVTTTECGKSGAVWSLLCQEGATDGFTQERESMESMFSLADDFDLEPTEPVFLLSYNNHPHELLDVLVEGTWLQECRDDLSRAGCHFILAASNAKVFVKPNQWDMVMMALSEKELRPYHIVVSASFEGLVEESVQSIRCRRRPTLKKGGRVHLCG